MPRVTGSIGAHVVCGAIRLGRARRGGLFAGIASAIIVCVGLIRVRCVRAVVLCIGDAIFIRVRVHGSRIDADALFAGQSALAVSHLATVALVNLGLALGVNLIDFVQLLWRDRLLLPADTDRLSHRDGLT